VVDNPLILVLTVSNQVIHVHGQKAMDDPLEQKVRKGNHRLRHGMARDLKKSLDLDQGEDRARLQVSEVDYHGYQWLKEEVVGKQRRTGVLALMSSTKYRTS
jgi:hypothetical protein